MVGHIQTCLGIPIPKPGYSIKLLAGKSINFNRKSTLATQCRSSWSSSYFIHNKAGLRLTDQSWCYRVPVSKKNKSRQMLSLYLVRFKGLSSQIYERRQRGESVADGKIDKKARYIYEEEWNALEQFLRAREKATCSPPYNQRVRVSIDQFDCSSLLLTLKHWKARPSCKLRYRFITNCKPHCKLLFWVRDYRSRQLKRWWGKNSKKGECRCW